jgi:catechol 2,3-dioxygenase-like lactoylglutathione lyase family enzyme
MIIAIDHVQLAMPPGQEDRARAFYEGVLGLREVPKPPDMAKRGGAWFEHGVVKIHLGVEDDFRPAKKAHPALVVQDMERLLEACRAFGSKIIDAAPIDGRSRAHVEDPFGNRVELISGR